MLHAGVDMHKRFSVVTLVDDEGNELLKGKRLDNDEGEIKSFFEEFDEDIQVVLEARPSWQWMRLTFPTPHCLSPGNFR